MIRTGLLFALIGCGPAPTPAAPPVTSPDDPPASTPATSDARPHGLTVVERWVGGAVPGDPAPTVVALHGRGDDPEHFAWIFEDWTTPTRVVLPRAPTAFADGFTWMPTPRAQDPRAFSEELRSTAAQVATLCRDEAGQTGEKPVLLGFSQGAMLAFAVAAQHPDAIQGAIPIGGLLPEDQRKPAGPVAPVRALHGRDDVVVPTSDGEATVAALRAAGADATLEVFPGVAHTLSREIRDRARVYASDLAGRGGRVSPPAAR